MVPQMVKETCAPAVNEDGPDVIVYVKGGEVNKFYKFKDPERPGDFLRLPCGKVIVKQCRKHNGGNKFYCVHQKENSKCRWCKELGLGGGTSDCPCGVRRELCPKCKGTSAGISKPAMARKAKAGKSSSAAPAPVPASAPAAPPAPAPAPAPGGVPAVLPGDAGANGALAMAQNAQAVHELLQARQAASVAVAQAQAPNKLRLCYFPKCNDHGWILLPDLFTKQGPETIETAFVALKRKVDDLEERENKRLKSANTLRLSA